ncbi:phenol 2-monooxygenase/3-hydroxybenzoate 4-monooxygenase [Noviherbaspirillum humi]|uniref:Phenol 2-monooxygenase/3-hydroxybenzoate 4-monooxygenase n=1 Tax=Noviherbaspirillum humi TaxID=1688639 RepID=A0A239LMW3_9BURK|nr:FAD-binding monooxygenase [Noviherbaspirillum humi]SNT31153.1 phenol 2-monooxygenase/3-hydroxybenzoate 4-monooxygenase [Noviherbaspirillum humi]
MQFHLDGFRPGDPHLHPASPLARPHTDSAPAQVDVLIVGCGPAGLTLAAQLAAFPEIHTAIVEQKDGPLEKGQADGIACRTMEMFEAFNFAERVLKESCWINEVTFWKPDEDNPRNIVRHGRVQDTEDGLSEFPHVVLNQARVHDFYLETMRNSPSRLEPHYARKLLDVKVDESAADYPVTVTLERTDPAHAGQRETVRARYVVGCDGARSATRAAIGRELMGEAAHQAWGVMDVLAVTDFPDVRYKVAIQSRAGSLLIIPREGGYLARLYVEMDKLGEDERVAQRQITVEQLIGAAQRIFHPYTLDVKEVAWWSVYEIGHRICDKYDNVTAGQENEKLPRVFIAGDACHTHSPKAGQGMNFSMQDTFNLGWKLAAVLRGQCPPSLLHSYNAERRTVGKQLIDFDSEWARMISEKPADGSGGGVDPKEFQKYFEQHLRFTAGMGTKYSASLICGDQTHQALATGFEVGTRFHSAEVLRITDAKVVHLGHAGKADGRWRLYAFAGRNDASDDGSGVRALCRFLETSPDSPVRRYTAANQDPDAVFDLRAVFQDSHVDLAIETMPALLWPQKGRHGLHDYEKVFSARLKHGPDIFDLRGVNREQGALVVVRPDQYIALVLPLDAHRALADFFAGFMLPQG